MGLIGKFFDWLFNAVLWLTEKSKLPKVKDIPNELKKVATIRIIVGCIVLARNLELLYINQFAESTANFCPLLILCAIMLSWTLGFLTPLMSLGIIFMAPYMDDKVGAVTLGTAILLQLVIMMTISRANGLAYSLDALLMKKRPNGLISKLYHLIGFPSAGWMNVSYFLGFMSYAIVSMVALSYHLMDYFWTHGYTFQVLSTSSYLCKYYDIFRAFEVSVPSVFRFISITAILGQSLFQFFMIPLIFWKPGRYFVEIWGWVFFVNCLILVQLSYLPHIELLLWWLLFVTPSLSDKVMLAFKAGTFNEKLARYIKGVSAWHEVKLEPVNQTGKMVVAINERELKGVERFAFMVRKLFTSTLFFPIIKLVTIFRKPSENTAQTTSNNPVNVLSFGNKALILLYLSMWLLYFPLRLPNISEKFKNALVYKFQAKGLYMGIAKVVYNFGLDCPVVFNQTDLEMSNRWAVLYYLDENDEKHKVHITGMDGDRESISGWDYLLFSNHNSDRLYFANTLKYRRGILGIKNQEGIEAWNSEGGLGNYILQYRAIILKKIYGIDSDRFWVEVYQNSSTDVQTISKEKYKATKIFEFPINL